MRSIFVKKNSKKKINKKIDDKKSFFVNVKDKITNMFFVPEEEYEMNKVVPSKKVFTKFEFFFSNFLMLMFGIVFGCIITVSTSSVIGYKISPSIAEFLKAFNEVKEGYYEELEDADLVNEAISGMLRALGDEHSYYMNEEETESLNSSLSGTFVGIGVTIQFSEGQTTILNTFANSPARNAGILDNDILIKVNDVDVVGKDSEEISGMIKGEIGTKVKIGVLRGEEELSFDLVLAEIEIESVTSSVKEANGKKIGYMLVDNFAKNTAKQFNNNLKNLESENIDSLIIDVRGNSGGHLTQVTEMLDRFFEKGTVLYSVENKGKKTVYKAKTDEKREYPVVVLINRSSASASEILAACFKDNYSNIKLVGNKSYGKGTVQKETELSNGSSYKFTTDKWLTPNGQWIHKEGITPDVEIDQNYETEEDEQLDEAIRILSE